MARFRGTLQGNRGTASRLGTPKSGLFAHINGWNVGVSVEACANVDDDSDLFEIRATHGSNGGDAFCIGFVHRRGGVVTFDLAESFKKKVANG